MPTPPYVGWGIRSASPRLTPSSVRHGVNMTMAESMSASERSEIGILAAAIVTRIPLDGANITAFQPSAAPSRGHGGVDEGRSVQGGIHAAGVLTGSGPGFEYAGMRCGGSVSASCVLVFWKMDIEPSQSSDLASVDGTEEGLMGWRGNRIVAGGRPLTFPGLWPENRRSGTTDTLLQCRLALSPSGLRA